MPRSNSLRLGLTALVLAGLASAAPAPLASQTYEDREFSSQNLVLPEMEQFRLGSRLFQAKDKKIAAWKAFQTFLFNYPDSPLVPDAQFMVAESIFQEALSQVQAGASTDEIGWKKQQKSGLRLFGKGLKKSLDGLKYIGATVAGEEVDKESEPEQIDHASFSEAIRQYKIVTDKYRKSGLADTALLRIAECYYDMGDYPTALEYFRRLQKEYAQSYLMGEALLDSAQCYIPGGDFGSAETELKKLGTNYPAYKNDPRYQFILGIVKFQEGKYDEALKNLEPIQSAEALYYSGQSLLKQGKGLYASAKFKQVADDYKDSPYAEQSAFLVGESFFLSENYPGAIQEFRKFAVQYPQSPLKEGALFRVAASNFLNKDYGAARESLNLLINSYPTGEYAALAKYFVGESYRLSDQLKEASFSYGQLISADPNAQISANASFKLSWVTYKQQNYSGAADSFQKYIDWHPYHPWVPYAYLLMGNCYAKLGRSEDAVNAYQLAFDRAPKTELSEAALALLNKTRYKQGNYGQLTSGYTYILKSLPPTDSKWRAMAQLYLADAYYRQKLYREAISVYQSIISLYPHLPAAIQARDGLSWCYFQQGDYAKAQSEREEIQNVQLPEGVAAPKMTTGNYELANALFNQKKYGDALQLFQKFLAEQPDSENAPEAIYRIGLCYYRQEYYTEAIQTWTDLAKKFPDNPRTEEAAFQIADTYFRAQKYDEAVASYRDILAKYPKNPRASEAALRIGQSYYNAGKDPQAVTEFDAFLRKYPDDKRVSETLDLMEASFDRMEASGGSRAKDIEVLKGLVDSFPNTDLAGEAQFRIARRMFNAKGYELAAPEFESVILNYPNSPHIMDAQFYAAESQYLLKKYDDAVTAFNRFLQNFPTSDFAPAALFHLGTSHYNSQDYDDAIKSYRDLLRQYPQSEFAPAALFNTALALKKQLKLPEAADAYTKLALNYPKDPNANYAMLEVAHIKKDLNQPGEAILVLKDLEPKIPQGDEMRQELTYLTAECYLANNDPDEAVKSLKSIAPMQPANSAWKLEALRKLGEIYEKQGKWAEAAQAYEDGGRLGGDPKVSASFRERAKYIRETQLGGKPAQRSKPAKNAAGGQ